MNCCGKKRVEWLHEMKVLPRHEIPESVDLQPVKEHKSIVFEYTGNRSIRLKGVNSGKVYHFKFRGDKIEVEREDSFTMMAERDLKLHILVKG